jgi:predicted DNA-binding transcriptional regulator AlpA
MTRFLSKKQVREKISLSYAQIDRLEAEGRFPSRVRVGFRVMWVEQEVEEWMLKRIAERRPTEQPAPA